MRSGAHWRHFPERYGKWRTVHRRFSRWCHAGVWEHVFDALTADRDNKSSSSASAALAST
ncbi:transposase [Sphingomonas cavernae]|uniref:Transposase n=1 Tax=Sphingomonas cavernae TaxID=2320861 RepID=A0A418WKR1_9SPHN|nr:transposase [Sphingomonas cavernae]